MTTPNNKKKSLSFNPQSESPAKKIKLEKEEPVSNEKSNKNMDEEDPVSNEKSDINTEADEEKVEDKRETVEEDMETEEAKVGVRIRAI